MFTFPNASLTKIPLIGETAAWNTFVRIVLFALCDKLGNLFTEITLSAVNLHELYRLFV